MTDYDVVETMTAFGGSFAQALAEAFRRADPENVRRLKAAFPELWAEYREIAALRKARASQ